MNLISDRMLRTATAEDVLERDTGRASEEEVEDTRKSS